MNYMKDKLWLRLTNVTCFKQNLFLAANHYQDDNTTADALIGAGAKINIKVRKWNASFFL